jgi:CRAL/TRIO domain
MYVANAVINNNFAAGMFGNQRKDRALSIGDCHEILGGEIPVFDEDVEEKGLQEIMAALTSEECNKVKDELVRYFRAEKVCQLITQSIGLKYLAQTIISKFLSIDFTFDSQGDVAKAVIRLRSTMQWRKSFQIDELVEGVRHGSLDAKLRDSMIREYETGAFSIRGYDKDGRVIIYVNATARRTGNIQSQLQAFALLMEKAAACTARKSSLLQSGRNGAPLEKFVVVVDYSGFTMKDRASLPQVKEILKMLQTHYPERLHRAYLISPPVASRIIYAIIRPFLDPVTKEKIVYCCGASDSSEQFTHSTEYQVGGNETDLPPPMNAIDYLNLPFDMALNE